MSNKKVQNKVENKTNTKVDMTAFIDGQIEFARNLEEAMSSNKSIIYTLGLDNSGKPTVYEVRKNVIGTFISEAKELKGSTGKGVQKGLVMGLPKIPFKILLQIVSLFRDVCDMMNGDEALIQLYWDKTKQEYFPFCPTQTTTSTNVTFLADKEKAFDDNLAHVMDIHSHNTMSAFFSATDDSSEKANKLYGVIGKINQPIPEYKFRTCNNGTYIDLSIFEVFETPTMTISFGDGLTQEVAMSESNIVFSQVDYPSEWFETIKRGKEERDKIRKEAQNHKRTTHHSTKVSYGGRSYGNKKETQVSIYNNYHGQQSLFNHDDYYLGATGGRKISKINTDFDEELYADYGVDEVEVLAEKIGDLSMFEFKMLIDLLYDQGLVDQITDVLQKDYGHRF